MKYWDDFQSKWGFGDGDHLGAMGKRRFTRVLAQELQAIGVLPRRAE